MIPVTDLLARHAKACAMTQPLDQPAAEDALRRWLAAIGAPGCEVRLVDDSVGAENAVWEAQASRSTQTPMIVQAVEAKIPQNVRTAKSVTSAWRSSAARNARAATAAREAKLYHAIWGYDGGNETKSVLSAWGSWGALDALDVPRLSVEVIGASECSDQAIYNMRVPLLEAFEAGVHLIWPSDRAVYYAPHPSFIRTDDAGRLHAENGPAFTWLGDQHLYFWRGMRVPPEWINDPASLTADEALRKRNTELRSAACEIMGWDRVISELHGITIDRHHEGDLVQVMLPDIEGPAKFLRARCGGRRRVAVGVPPETRTALEARQWADFRNFGLDVFGVGYDYYAERARQLTK